MSGYILTSPIIKNNCKNYNFGHIMKILKTFKVDLAPEPELAEDIQRVRKKYHVTNIQLLRIAIDVLDKQKNKRKSNFDFITFHD